MWFSWFISGLLSDTVLKIMLILTKSLKHDTFVNYDFSPSFSEEAFTRNATYFVSIYNSWGKDARTPCIICITNLYYQVISDDCFC